ncbi:hypothetical protein [uncultured Eubacterium sp.]|uniref:hypothetical protein n=1 Tax=uncultured Eubacterium sp. TaxID=165185 RepID=UPI0025966B7E|nr:hypothetical protein [uncultured Eubacterium sp.]
MNKSVLVLDTPNSCSQCNFCREVEDVYVESCDSEACCTVMFDPNDTDLYRMILTKDKYKKEKPEWCPLKEFPERSNTQQGAYELDEYCSGYDDGWNEFRKEILGETIYEKLEEGLFDEEEDKND